MAIVLAGFLGSPGRFYNTPQEYKDAHYQFKEETVPREAKFFSIALREFLNACGRAPQRWLILGTEKSIWDALYQAVPNPDDQFETVLHEVAEATRKACIDQPLLNRWSQELERLLDIEVVCFLTGNAEEPEEQAKVWSVMEQHVHEGDKVIFDITHSLRHFAVISTFSVMLLRELRNIDEVDFYYGALELTTEGISHVIHIPICQQLAKASQAVAIHKLTGDFRSLGECLDVSPTFNENLKKVAYSDELNRPQAELADELQKEMPKAKSFLSEVLKPLLEESLAWVAHKRLDRQYERKALKAFAHEQYFQAVAYLYEAIVLADCYAHVRGNYLSYGVRTRRTRRPRGRFGEETQTELEKTLKSDQLEVFKRLSFLRNSVLHGTKSEDKYIGTLIETAIDKQDKATLETIFKDGQQLFKDLSYPNRKHQ